ncbi:hypothetical protein SPI_06315 [Niveomyces insectorum RCEF 264]|uniref:Uncharacterized protein n=1 Tax=Niveomyces insectorum RCEF 264 TaxID=1081102 RepID=A0A167S0J6_9HYPO|nr:hypothetical protein SPI_06315 [Niveomyces insectorum RCEF 264]
MAAALPRQFPALALHLTDPARTPILSSAAPAEEDDNPSHEDHIGDHNSNNNTTLPRRPTRLQRAAALDAMAATAFRARSTAARLGLGVPDEDKEDQDEDDEDEDRGERDGHNEDGQTSKVDDKEDDDFLTPPDHLVVTYNTGAVVLAQFLDPRDNNTTRQRPRPGEDHQAPPGQPGPSGVSAGPPAGRDRGRQQQQRANRKNAQNDANHAATATAAADSDTNGAPWLLSLVAAPDAQALGSARRAAVRLARGGRAVQQELTVDDHQPRQGVR